MQMKRFFLVLVALSGSWLVWTVRLAAQNDPTAVGLLYFTAAVQSDGVRLDWETATELNTAGFYVYRSSNGNSFVMLNDIGFVVSTGGLATGATYSETDTMAVIGQTYTYKLVELETDSSQHDLETVTVTFNPQPTATPIVIGGTNPTATPGSTPAAAAATPTATATTQNTGQPTVTSQLTATPDNSGTLTTGGQPTRALQPTAALELDQAVTGNGVGTSGTSPSSTNPDSAGSGIVLAQEEPTLAAYPGPDSPPTDAPTDIDSDFYPDEQEAPAEIAPENSTPYPASTSDNAVPTLAVIGSSDPYPPEAEFTAPAPSAEVIRGRILLWASFLLALFIFFSGVVGAIVLYRRRPA